jgi:hypothetical protein
VILGFKKKSVPNYVLRSEEVTQNDRWFVKFHLFQDEDMVSLSDWSQTRHRGAIWLVDYFKAEQDSFASDFSISIPFEKLMAEFEGQENYFRNLIEFPPIFDGGIYLESQGLIHSHDYKLTYSWINGTGRQITNCERRAGFIIIGGKRYLLPIHAWKMVESLDAIKLSIDNSSTISSRLEVLERFERLKELLPETERGKFSESSDISNLKIHFANAFRIEAIPEASGYNFRPILLRRREAIDSNNITFESILPPSEQVKYADYFKNSTNLLPYYNLGVGKYLIVGEQLGRVLAVVHKIQHASAEDRLKFLKNPKAAIADSLDGVIDFNELDAIFSDRVTGLGEWNAKVIPWMQLPSSEWIPSYELPNVPKGIDIGGVRVELTTEAAKALLQRMEAAQKAGEPFVVHSGVQIPVNNSSRASLAALVPRSPETSIASTEAKFETAPHNVIMLVKENLESVEFAAHRVKRTSFPSQRGIPDAVRTAPKPHQEEAFNWLCDHYKIGSRGVLLADDMGLGKTFQSLMFLAWIRRGIEVGELPEKPLLIVAPTGLLNNWEAEIERHLLSDLGDLVRAFGNGLKAIRSGSSLNTAKIRNAGLVLTTYDTLTRYQTSFGAVSFSAVIFDEVQKLKNPGIQNYSAASSLNCEFWVGMTGTPVENRLCDLWAITDVLQPGLLGSIKEFSNKYEKAMLEGGDIATQRIMELQDGLITPAEDSPAFMLRRMKHERLPGLPKKHIHEHPLQMPAEQVKAYNDILNEVAKSEGRKGAMLEALQKLRACSLHPDYKRQQQYVSDDDFIKRSARLQSCFNILDKIHAKNEKALIFVEYNEWHKPEFLRDIIKNRYSLKELPMVINGQVDSEARQARVDAFQKVRGVFDVMLLSPRAGGVGLTLTAANHVIHLTRWWNPAVEDQATDRVYRIGQEAAVHVHYPLAIHPDHVKNCFDHNLNQLLDTKRKLSTQVLIAVQDEGGIMESLIGKTFGSNREFEVSLSESYVLSGQEFEDIVLRRLQKFAPTQGYQVRFTKKSWDGGADMIVETNDGQIAAILQCKHVSKSDKSPVINEDLERAFQAYGCARASNRVMKIGITNSSKLANVDKHWENLSDDNLIIYAEDGLKPEILFKSMSV